MERQEALNLDSVEKDILKSESAQDILPYLTLDKLSQENEAELLSLSSEVLEKMQNGELPNNKFATVSLTEDAIANIAGETEAWEDGRITPKLMQARKLFCASLFDATSKKPEIKWEVYDSFFGMSPDISSYCGGLKGSLELLTVAERTENNPCAREIYDEIVYDYSFNHDNDFAEIFKESSPIGQLRLLPIYNKIALHCDPDDWNKEALNKVWQTLKDTKNDQDTRPLIRIVADSVDKNLSNWFYSEWVEIDEDDPRITAANTEVDKKQEALHQEFPGFRADQDLIKIAPGIAATISGGVVNTLLDKSGEKASLLNYSRDNAFGLDRDMASLIGAAHNPGVKELINKKLGMNLETIPFDAQKHLLKFMTEADNKRFDKLCNTLHGLNNHLKLELAENFLAADFGEDFGDSLLTVANSTRLDNKEKARIFDNISSCRESIKSITGLYEHLGLNDDGEFAKEYARAANERITDVVTVFAEIARRGYAEADLDWAGKQRFNYDSALEALNYERKSLEIISGTFNDVADGKDGAYAKIVLHKDEEFQRLRRTVYDLYSPDHGHVLFYTRADGSHSFDPDVEYGKVGSKYNYNSRNTGVEASLSMIADPVDPFSVISPYKPDKRALHNPHFYDDATMNKVSAIRLDREGRSPEWAADDSRRDPVNRVGTISVDLAAIGDRADTPSGKIARLLATGNAIRAANRGGLASLNHNTNWFNQDKYGTSDGFKEIVDKFDQAMLQLVEVRQPRARMQKLGNAANSANTGDNSAA